tara:strand:- start:1182 stop:2693 length:1512 start_codon:yes stop_codon:yes gene_type:complete
MNLVQIANELEYVPKQQLAEMSQNPDSRYPQYLVISEIQRRTKNEKAYAAMKQQPTTTVAEEVVNEFIQPKGLQAGMPSGSAPTDVFSPESSGMPASAPMQMAASGGRTGYYGGGYSAFGESGFGPGSFSSGYGGGYSVKPNSSQGLSQMVNNPIELGGNVGASETIPIESLSESDRAEIVEKSEGLSRGQKAILGLDALALALLVTPAPGARIAAGVTKLLALGGRGISALSKMNQVRRANKFLKAGQKEIKRKGGLPATTPYNPQMVRDLGQKALRRDLPVKLGAGTLAAGSTYALIDPESPLGLTNQDGAPETEEQRKLRLAAEAEGERLAKIQAARDEDARIVSLTDFVNAKDARSKAERRKAGLDIAQLGGVILGSRNLTEMGKGIAGLASDIQTRDATQDLSEAQQQYYQAQTGKIQAETAMMPAKQLRTEIDTYAKYLKTLIEQNDGSEQSVSQITQVQEYINSLTAQLAKIQGYASVDKEEERQRRLRESGISVT